MYITLLEYRNCSFVMFCTWEKKSEKNLRFCSVCVCVGDCECSSVCETVSECMCHMHGAKPAVLSIYCEVFTVFCFPPLNSKKKKYLNTL